MVRQDIENLLNNSISKLGIEGRASVSFSFVPAICDFQSNSVFSIAKKIGEKPLSLAQKIVENIEKSDFFSFEVVAPAFINIKLTKNGYNYFANFLLNEERCGVKKLSNQKVLLDYGGANVAKALHVGHLRSPIIGESLKRLYKFLGEDVVSDVHLGDWGLQMGLTELQLYQDGVLDYYFGKSDKEPEITLEMLNEAYPKASARKNQDEQFKKEADAWTLKIQEKKEPYFTIFKKIRNVSVKKIKNHYSELGANFDLWYGESDCDKYIPLALKIIDDKGLSRESEGAVIVDVAVEGENVPIEKRNDNEVQRYKNPMPPAILKKYNGGTLYATTDIATILMRNEEIKNLSRIEYIVDLRQSLHFTQVFRVCKMSGISPKDQQLLHIGYGTMNGKDGKPFKTRAGDTVKLEDVINLLIDKASEKLRSNNVEFNRDTALKIGVGAMKFGDLSNNVGKDYVFDLDKFLSFEGKTGPYIQYTVCRINSILSKANCENGNIYIDSEEERDIINKIFRLNSSYEICYKEKSLNNLCLATYELASSFSTLYNNHKILSEENEIKRKSLLSLLKLVKKELIQALDVLAIEVPEKM